MSENHLSRLIGKVKSGACKTTKAMTKTFKQNFHGQICNFRIGTIPYGSDYATFCRSLIFGTFCPPAIHCLKVLICYVLAIKLFLKTIENDDFWNWCITAILNCVRNSYQNWLTISQKVAKIESMKNSELWWFTLLFHQNYVTALKVPLWSVLFVHWTHWKAK